jgi:hypothetical protein
MAVFGLLAVDELLLIHRHAAGLLPLPVLGPRHRAPAASTHGRNRETGPHGLDMAMGCVVLLFGAHVRVSPRAGGAAEVSTVGVEADGRGAWG